MIETPKIVMCFSTPFHDTYIYNKFLIDLYISN